MELINTDEIRCPCCNQLLLRASITLGKLEIKCCRCKKIIKINIKKR
ncbi:Com family DNA-binding transcriptional regulator [Clostridium perfringens]|nr:Com family DNA-binding transcriptional regulator [Clostridium perfringens]